MTKHLHILLTLALLLPLPASAQWYLFPGGRSKRDTTQRRPVSKPEARDSVRLTLILPFRSDATPNSNFLQFYTGVLTAADTLAAGGMPIVLQVYDCAREDAILPVRELHESDLVIGPVSVPDLHICTTSCPDQYFISPLDPKAAEMIDSCRIVQAPSSYDDQLEELARWLAEDYGEGDRIICLKDEREAMQPGLARFLTWLQEADLPYTEAGAPAESFCTPEGCTRYVLLDAADEYCAEAVREIALERMRGLSVSLYAHSRLRASGNVDEESLRKADTRLTASFSLAGEQEGVRNFSERYLRRFKADPGSFAYQGYDVTLYFLQQYERFGTGWFNHLPARPASGLQSDFRFRDDRIGAGQANRAVRREHYGSGSATAERPAVDYQEIAVPDSISIFDRLSPGLAIRQDPAIRKATELHIFNNAMKTAQGLGDQRFCIRIFFDNSQKARENSQQVANRFRSLFPDIPVTRSFSDSFFKVTVGEYNSRAEAGAALKQIKIRFPSAFIVRK